MILMYIIQLLQGQMTILEFVQFLVFSLIAIVLAITIHEWGHAFVSFLQGDKTAKYDGRLSLNPFKHLDKYGILMFLLFGFGWARPVNVRASQYKKPRLGLILTAASGPLSNFLLAFLVSPLLFWSLTMEGILYSNLFLLFSLIFSYNMSLGLFNLIPVPPLDGSKILGECLPLKYRLKYYGIERYGFMIAFGIVIILNQIGTFGFIEEKMLGAFMHIWAPLFR